MVILNKRTEQMLNMFQFSGGLAYLFEGNRGVGRMTYAREAAADFLLVRTAVLADHPDYFEISTKGKLGMSDFEGLREFCTYLPAQAPCRIAVIDADSITDDAQASLLKLLEDGAAHCMFILILNSRVLPTIVSRCRVIEFLDLSENQMESFGGTVTIRQLACGRPGVFFELSGTEYALYVSTCEQAVYACQRRDRSRLLEVLHLVKEKDRLSFYECYGQEKTALFLRYLGDRLQDHMISLASSGSDDYGLEECYRQIVILVYGEYVRLKNSKCYTKNDFFEFVRLLCNAN